MTYPTPYLRALAWQQQPRARLSTTQKQWLTRQGALTDGLRSLGNLKLVVLVERTQKPAIDEALCLQLRPNQAAWIREVVMSVDGIPCVIARSLTDRQSSTGVWRGIRQLGTKPLADMLYNDARVRRSPFGFTNVRQTQGLAQALSNWNNVALHHQYRPALLARRSLFICQTKRLLVSECFLPSFWQLIKHRTNIEQTRDH
jgi:chorismate--pyruvate lyase